MRTAYVMIGLNALCWGGLAMMGAYLLATSHPGPFWLGQMTYYVLTPIILLTLSALGGASYILANKFGRLRSLASVGGASILAVTLLLILPFLMFYTGGI